MSNFSRTQTISKTVIETEGGVVASQHSLAAQAGAEVLAAGGDAVDATVAASFVLGVLEPWMSGPAGGGAMMLWRADEGRAVALNHGMRSPAGLNPADYPLTGRGVVSGDLFPWEEVEDNRNVRGATAVAVPGVVDGLGRAHERWGRTPWAELLQPAIEHAKRGMLVDWYAALCIASSTRELAPDPDAAALFLTDGQWPTIGAWTALSETRLDQSRMADSLDQIARHGARALYDGDLGAAMARDMQDKGGSLSQDDLRAYAAQFSDPLSFEYRGMHVHATPGLTAGPTLRHALTEAAKTTISGDAPDAAAFNAYARGLRGAYAERLGKMGDDGEHPEAPGCTTHFSVVDRHGNMVAQTQTLLSIFGSRVVSPSTGFLMNNGVMWFDPVPGRPNSLGPGKRCLMNVCPIIGEGPGDRHIAIGASGGRKIVSAITQLTGFMADYGMDIGAAFHHPRIDVSGLGAVIADEALPAAVTDALRAEYDLLTAPRTSFPYAFACPAGVMRRAGRNSGCTEIMSPWGDAVGEDQI